MNKKCASYVVIAVLCLNLLPQTCNAFKLDKTGIKVIYDSEVEKKEWETFYLPYAKHFKIVNKTATVLDVAKMAEKEADDENLLADIMNRTDYHRKKALVKWEKDNQYIDTKAEKDFNITPATRLQLLAEIREEEKSEREKEGK